MEADYSKKRDLIVGKIIHKRQKSGIRTVRNKYAAYKPPSLWYFVKSALTNHNIEPYP